MFYDRHKNKMESEISRGRIQFELNFKFLSSSFFQRLGYEKSTSTLHFCLPVFHHPSLIDTSPLKADFSPNRISPRNRCMPIRDFHVNETTIAANWFARKQNLTIDIAFIRELIVR